MPKNFILLSIIIFCSNVQAKQIPDDYDQAYAFVRDSVLPIDFHRAKVLGDSLLRHAKTNDQKISTIMLLAVISTQMDNHVDALDYALQAEKKALKVNNYEWQVRTAGFLSAVFRDVNLHAQAVEHIKVAEKANQKLKHLINYPYVQFSIHGEKAAYYAEDKDYEIAIKELLKRKEHIDAISEADRSFYLASHHDQLGHCYLGLKNYEEANTHFKKALNFSRNSGNIIATSAFVGLGEVAKHKSDYPLALQYFKKAEESLSTNAHYSAKILIYKSFSDYYTILNKSEEALHYNNLYLQTLHEKERAIKEISNQLIARSLIEKQDLSQRYTFVLGVVVVLITMSLLLLLYIKKIKRRAKEKYDVLMERLDKKSSLITKSVDSVLPVSRRQNETFRISSETEKRLLAELEKMEKDCFFLDPTMSLSTLVANLRSNSRYVSYIINTHKKKDFNNYVNELRIIYIIDKLQHAPQYQNYKLAYIAEHCGFSSHSKFAAVFKEFSGLSPSTFITILKEEQKDLT